MTFGLAHARPSTVALYLVGESPQNLALGNGCTLLRNPTILVVAAVNARGRNALTSSFPPGLSLTAFVQGFVVDAGAPARCSATNEVTLTVTP